MWHLFPAFRAVLRALWLFRRPIQREALRSSGTQIANSFSGSIDYLMKGALQMTPIRPMATYRRDLTVLTATVVAAAVLGCLYWAHAVLIPLCLALILTFILNPLVTALQRQGLGRLLAVIVASLIAASVILAIAWTVATEFGSLIDQLPSFTETLRAKIERLRSAGEGGIVERLSEMISKLSAAWRPPNDGNSQRSPEGTPLPVVIEDSGPLLFRWLPTLLPPTVELLSQLGFVTVLVIFMLLDREALRNRFIRLIGKGHMTTTTKAVDEATHRISRFLLMQLAVNACYGFIFAIGLAVIGVQHAALWGFLTALLRYIPYLGAPVAALLPVIMSIMQTDGWWAPLCVLALFGVLEGLTYSFLEPVLYGRTTGVSALALLAAAAFWAFFWGPIGLVLSCPLTVCLAVLGKYVPQLHFLWVLLSDEPALEKSAAFYQRLSAGDEEEATTIVKQYAQEHSDQAVFDGLFLPALVTARIDHQKGGLNDSDMQLILNALRVIASHWAAKPENDSNSAGAESSPLDDKVAVVMVPARDEVDLVAVELARMLLAPAKWEVHVAGDGLLPVDILAALKEHHATLIVIGAVRPGPLSRPRYLCKRLKKQMPELRIIAGVWGRKNIPESVTRGLRDAGADRVETSLLGLSAQLAAWRPVLLEQEAKAPAKAQESSRREATAANAT
jgi:predicted PurR-regulated permease PerM